MWWRHLGSTLALVLGVAWLLISLIALSSGKSPNAWDGVISAQMIIVGAVAYRSAKGRLLGQVAPTTVRKAAEALAMLVIFLLVFWHEDWRARMALRGAFYVVVPGWALAAYLAVAFRQPRNAIDTKVFD